MTPTTVTFLGTSSVVPGYGHDTASFLINGRYLVDTGWYATLKMRGYRFDPMQLEYLFLTHCHHDHYIGLPQLLFYLRMRRRERPDRPPLRIVGPAEDLERVVTLARQFLQTERFPDVECIPELFPLSPGESFEDAAFRLDTCATVHPVQGLCYRFTDRSTGAVFAFTGDTAYHAPIAAHVRGVPLLIHEASYGPDPAPAENRSQHSGAPEAARIAVEAGVGRLALVHCPEEKQAAAVAAAQAIFPNTFWPADGETVTVEG
jgi:ribonuclease Z